MQISIEVFGLDTLYEDHNNTYKDVYSSDQKLMSDARLKRDAYQNASQKVVDMIFMGDHWNFDLISGAKADLEEIGFSDISIYWERIEDMSGYCSFDGTLDLHKAYEWLMENDKPEINMSLAKKALDAEARAGFTIHARITFNDRAPWFGSSAHAWDIDELESDDSIDEDAANKLLEKLVERAIRSGMKISKTLYRELYDRVGEIYSPEYLIEEAKQNNMVFDRSGRLFFAPETEEEPQ